ncbi:MAG TPA: hypothetical protein VMV02_08105 [Acidimicrobiales bacterium]|nr:hypothetical protein [Acidimicrobiales bacterium]
MSRDTDLEIRRRSAVMAPAGSSIAVSREELLADLAELQELRRRAAALSPEGERALQRHPSRPRRAT